MLLLCSAVTEAGGGVDTEIDGKDYGWRQATVDTFDLGAVGGVAARQTPLNQHYGNGPVNLYPSSDFDRVTAGGSLVRNRVAPLGLLVGHLHLRLRPDRTSLEVFENDGKIAVSPCRLSNPDTRKLLPRKLDSPTWLS